MKYTFTVKEDGPDKETKQVPGMSYKKILKSLLNTQPKWSGMIEYTNKKGKSLMHLIRNGKKYSTHITTF
tara:strand:+ start:394 stop:603 length:210 start_codon:yes stop_codon:yes gene_type:complete